ncbi:MAG: DUF2336 domain-containing protein [Minwuiales bacterium]|nr:DUF2336 domain-containing protein [Minwuiales bacterium]
MLRRIFSGKRKAAKAKREPISYDESREVARHGDLAARRDLAQREDVRPEVLYYLAEDGAPEVRREIAANAKTPAQANLLLATDEHEEVRLDIALKIGRLLPQLTENEKSRVRELTLEALEILAQDQLPKVRAILAEELKHSMKAPHHIVMRLAKDVEAIVAAPILEYSPLLSDDDLLEIIASGVAVGALPALARRENVVEPVSDAIVATMDVPAVAALLANPSAQIREETLDKIIDNGAAVTAWHEPLVMRPELSVRAIRRIATFVARSLVETLVKAHNIDAAIEAELKQAVEDRIRKAPVESEETKVENVEKLFAEGKLDDQAIGAAFDRGDTAFVVAALHLLSGAPKPTVQRIIGSGSAAAVTALSWRAGLSMRNAIQVQRQVAKLPPTSVLNARNGVDYPLSENDMKSQLEIFAA